MAQLAWCPVGSDVGGLAGCLVFPPDVGRVQGCAGPGGEDKTVIAPPRAGRLQVRSLPLFVGPQRVHRHPGLRQGPARFVGLGVPVGAYGPPDGGAGQHGRVGVRIAEVDVLPAQGSGLFGSDAGGQAQGDVGVHPGALGGCQERRCLVQGLAHARPPGLPLGVSTSVATLRPTRSRASAWRIARVSALWPIATAAVEYRAAIAVSAWRTSSAVSSRSLLAPIAIRIGARTFSFFLIVLADRPSNPSFSQYSASRPTG